MWQSHSGKRTALALVGAIALGLGLGGTAMAAANLQTTAAGTAAGFGPTAIFASGFATDTNSLGQFVGPNGMAFLADGSVLVTNFPGNVYVFPTSANGQTVSGNATLNAGASYGAQNAIGLAQLGGNIYMTQQGGPALSGTSGAVVQINSNGTFNQTILTDAAGTLPGYPTGITANPSNGLLYVSNKTASAGGKIIAVDPVTKTGTTFVTGLDFPDGMAINADGSILYVADETDVKGYYTGVGGHTAGTLEFDAGAGSFNGSDGIAVGIGPLANDIFVNTNFGQVIEIDLITKAQMVIAQASDITNGTPGNPNEHADRGDFMFVNPLNGGLYVTQSTEIDVFVPTPPLVGGPVPLPAAAGPGVAMLALLAIAGWLKSRARRTIA